jgi:sporulation integral membrane protein YtvI
MSSKLHLRRGIASAACIIILFLSFVGIFALVISKLIYEAIEFVQELPQLLSSVPLKLQSVKISIVRFINKTPDSVRDYLTDTFEGVSRKVADIPLELSSKALSKLSDMAGSAPKVILFGATYIISSFFISSSYPQIRDFIIKQIPARFHLTARSIKSDILSGFGKWIKAQLTLMGITFIELTLALTLLGFKYAAVIAIITAFIDALPVFGTGIVLLPWAIILLLGGDTSLAIGLVITYLVITTVRSCLEPKIVGDQFGIHPAASLLAMYSGYKLFGIAGMIFFPFLLMMLKQMNDKGYIQLWK